MPAKAMSNKKKELVLRGQNREKELNDFLTEKGDNITAADLSHAHTIRDDLREIKNLIAHEDEVDGLRSEAKDFNDFLTRPTQGMRHQAVIGAGKSGETVIRRGSPGKPMSREHKILRQHGAGIFGAEKFAAIKTREYRKAFSEYIRHGERLNSAHFRMLEDGLDPQGGYLAPVETIARLIERKPAPTRVSGMVATVNSSRDAVALPRVNYNGNSTDDPNAFIYTTGFRATATDENPTSDTQALVSDTNIFGSVRVPIYTWLIEGILTNNQVEDSMFDPMAWMTGKFLETIQLLKDQMILTGNGVGQTKGILTSIAPTAGDAASGFDTTQFVPYMNSTSSASIIADNVIQISEDVPEQYEDNCCFVYKKTSTGKTIRLFKDSQNRYLFGMGYQDSGLVPGRQKALNGYPVIFSQFMPDLGANNNPLIFGDLQGFTEVNRVGFSIQVLREIAARRNQVIILGRVRFGGLTVEPWRLRILQCHT